MKKFIFPLLAVFILTGCKNSDELKNNCDKLKIKNAQLEKDVKDLQLKISEENHRIELERQRKEQIAREQRIANLRNTIDGSYNVGTVSCTISNGKITWSAGKSYNKLVFNGIMYGNKSYSEYSGSGYYAGEFIFYQDYSKGTYIRADGTSFQVSKIFY